MLSPLRRLGRKEDRSELAMVLGWRDGIMGKVDDLGLLAGGKCGGRHRWVCLAAWRESTRDRLDEGSCRQLVLVKDVGRVWPVYLRFLGVRVS